MIKLTPFTGLIPRMGPRLLPDTAATVATNLKLYSGELRPLRQPKLIYTPASPKNALQISIFNARNGADSEAWFTWPVDVDCVRVPLATDVESRFCWTGDGVPKIIKYTNAVSGAGENYPLAANELALGIPAPITAPTVTPSATGTGSTVTRYYCYTFFSQDGEESSPSPISAATTGKIDDTWAISTIDAAPVNSASITDVTYVGTSVTITSTTPNYNRVGDLVTVAGVTTVTNVNGTWTLTARTSTTQTFTVTSTPTGAYNNGTDTTDTWTRAVPWNTSGMVKYLYRTTGAAGSWQLVNDTGIAAATTTYDDTLTDAQIAGDELISDGWIPPPVGLTCLCVHPSGALVGLVGNLLCMSEPYQPHAWPTAYQLASGYNGVGIAIFGTSIVMATAGMPYIATGVEPASMSGEDVQGMYPCLSKRSVISIGNAVLYASLHGMVQVGAQGIGMYTQNWYTRDQWELLNPDTMICATAMGRLYVVYTDANDLQSMLIFDGPELTTTSVEASEIYADVSSGELYISTVTGVSIWDSPDKVVLQAAWRSKDFVFPAPINIGAGKIEFDLAVDPSIAAAITAQIAADIAANAILLAAGNLGGAWNDDAFGDIAINDCALVTPPEQPASNLITVSLFSGSRLLASRVVDSTRVFRLPGGYKHDVFSVQITSQCEVKEIRLAETPNELRTA